MNNGYTVDNLIEDLQSNLDAFSPSEREKALSFLHKHRIKQAREDFYVFVRTIAPLIIPEPFKDGVHIHLFCNELENLEKEISAGRNYKLQFFLPPGAMKTLIL